MNESLSFSGVSSVTATGNEELKMMTEKTGDMQTKEDVRFHSFERLRPANFGAFDFGR
jgi:hypothetical protein